jgi:hypothetical protein
MNQAARRRLRAAAGLLRPGVLRGGYHIRDKHRDLEQLPSAWNRVARGRRAECGVFRRAPFLARLSAVLVLIGALAASTRAFEWTETAAGQQRLLDARVEKLIGESGLKHEKTVSPGRLRSPAVIC